MITINALWRQRWLLESDRLFKSGVLAGMTMFYICALFIPPTFASETLSVPAGQTPPVAPLIKNGNGAVSGGNKEKASPGDISSADGEVGGNKKGLIFFPMKINYSQQDDKGGVVVNVVNPTEGVYLLQGTVSAFDADTGRAVETKDASATPPPFVILPPLRRLGGGDRTALRVRQAGGGLPQDRESAAIISVKTIPAEVRDTSDPDVNKAGVRIALRMNMRLFWRPASVPEPDMKKIASSLTFTRRGDSLDVSNPTPWFVHFTALDAGGKAVQESALNAWVPPMGHQTFKFDQPVSGTLTWKLSGDENAHQTKQ